MDECNACRGIVLVNFGDGNCVNSTGKFYVPKCVGMFVHITRQNYCVLSFYICSYEQLTWLIPERYSYDNIC